MIVLSNANKTYTSKRGTPCHALKDANLRLGERGMYFILGKSGSGKSTLLNILGGLDRVDEGEVYYRGKAFSSLKEKELEGYRNNVVGFIFQEYNLIENFDVYANVSLALNLQGEKEEEKTAKAVAQALETVELSGYERRSVSELSGGQQQRVAIARALVKSSSILLADEPTGNLDSETSEDIFRILKNVSKNKLVVVVSHDLESAEKYGDGIIRIKDGEVTPCDECALSPDFQPASQSKNSAPLENAKLPWGYVTRFAFRNLLQKKFKSVLTVLSTIFMVVFICGMHVLYAADANRNIAYSAQNMGVRYFSLEQRTGEIYGAQYADVEDFSVYSEMESAQGVHTFGGYYAELPLPSEIRIESPTGSGSVTTTWEIDVLAYLIESKTELATAGIPLYENSVELSDGGIYLSDVAVKLFLSSGYAFSDGTTDFAQMGGKILTNSTNTLSIPVCGVIKTGLIEFLSPPLHSNKHNVFRMENNPTEAQLNAFVELTGAVFMTKGSYLNTYARDLDEKTQEKLQFTLQCGEKLTNANFLEDYNPDGFYFSTSQYDYRVYTTNGLKAIEAFTLQEGEILLPYNTYAQLFPEEKIDDLILRNGIVEEWEALVFSHVGEKITPVLTRKSLEGNLFLGGDYRLAGVLLSNTALVALESSAGKAYIKNGLTEELLSPTILLAANNHNLLATFDNAEAFTQALNLLRDDYGVGVADSSYFAEILYGVDSVLKQAGNVFLILFVISLLTSVLLLINLITLSVTARKKEIGILKALGTGNFDLKKIFLLEALFLALVALLVGAVGTVWLVGYANGLMSETAGMVFFASTPATYLLMTGITLFVMPLLAFLPLQRITKLNPVDAIKR